MKTFLVAMKGTGDGCDYTIGCNMRYKLVMSDKTIDELTQKEIQDALFHGEDDQDYINDKILGKEDNEISELFVVELENYRRPNLGALRGTHNEMVQQRRTKKREEKERLEFERLKAKFGS